MSTGLYLARRRDEILRRIEIFGAPAVGIRSIDVRDEETMALFTAGETEYIPMFDTVDIRRWLRRISATSISHLAALNALHRPLCLHRLGDFATFRRDPSARPRRSALVDYLLQETCGLLVYREQIAALASTVAGYTLGEAAGLSRCLASADRLVLDGERSRFYLHAEQAGLEELSMIEEVFELIAEASSYAFDRHVSVATTTIAFQIAYMKAHYRVAFDRACS